MALIECPECKKEISDKAVFCPNCGLPVSKIKTNDDKVIHNQGKKNNNKPNRKVIYVVSSIVFVALLGVALYFATGNYRTYNVAKRALKEENYDLAKEKFKVLKDYKDSEILLAQTLKQEAISNDITPPQLQNIPANASTEIGEEFDFEQWIKDSNAIAVDDISDTVELVVLSDEVNFNVPGWYNVFFTATDEAGNKAEAKRLIEVKDYPTHQAYIDATNLTVGKLNKTSDGEYYFKNIHVSSDEIEYLESGAIYRSLAMQLEGGYVIGKVMYSNWGSDIIPTVFVVDRPASWAEAEPMVDKASRFINKNNSLTEVMTVFSKMESVNGTFDFINCSFDFEIADLPLAASELEITESMLGYMLAMLEEYAVEASFDGNSYSCNYILITNQEDKNFLNDSDFMSYVDVPLKQKTEKNELEELKVLGDESYIYYGFSPDGDDYKGGVVTTHRQIQIGTSYNSVVYRHGVGKEEVLDLSTDPFYNSLKTYSNEDSSLFEQQCASLMAYNTKDGKNEMVFFFNDNKEVSWIIYINGKTYI